METKLVIEKPGEHSVTILKGHALDPQPPRKLAHRGDIHSVSNFVTKRYNPENTTGLQALDNNKVIVIADKERGVIFLDIDPTDPYAGNIIAELQVTEELNNFQINTAKKWKREELVRLFSLNRRFLDGENGVKLLAAFKNLILTGTTAITQTADNRGAKQNDYTKTIDSQKIPLEFILNIPIFKGFGKETFRVEICLDATDNSVMFWFESVELIERMAWLKDEIFAAELKSCEDFVIIYQ